MHPDHRPYYRFTQKSRVEKAVNSLMGVVQGIVADQIVTRKELEALQNWVAEYKELREQEPFNEFIAQAEIIVEEKRLSEEDMQDILWLCNKFSQQDYFDRVTADLQVFHGIMGGIIADEVISAEELRGLYDWMEDHRHLSRTYPYTEIERLLCTVLQDGIIDAGEHMLLMSFLSQFSPVRPAGFVDRAIDPSMLTVKDVCAVSPEIDFDARCFCFTGSFKDNTRKDLHHIVEDRKGKIAERVVMDLDYLIIGSQGNPCWAYASYGRKIEAAMRLRSECNRPVLLVHEFDFLDAVRP